MKNLKNYIAQKFPASFKKLSFIYNAKIVKFIWLIFNKPKGTLVYVGLNVGESFSRLCYRYADAYGYEPNPVNFKKVQKKLKNQKNLKLFNLAAAEKNGTAILNISDNGNDFAASSLADFSNNRNVGISKKIEIKTINLYDHLTALGVKKIDDYMSDTEGYDFTILKTLTPMIEGNKIHKITCEIVKNNKTGPFKNVMSSMEDFDKFLPKRYQLKATGWTNLTENVFDSVPEDWNFYDALWVNESYNKK